ncbi:MAG: hypothetical protein QF691_09070 [SAR324 cluster bacterium]|jgi:hypothetical protein|nr:hypothetical protein [SAR324 cluster bacterium]|tara:strand:- start:361 stop:783 length:423 start_codon:yes stop_codon:yes gene_type:complete
MNQSLQEVKQQFIKWRKQKSHPRQSIPETLWQAAIALLPDYTKSEIVRTLQLNYSALRQRMEASQSVSSSEIQPVRFVEVDFSSPEESRHSDAIFCDRVEVQRRDGSRLSLYAREGESLDGMVLLKAFLGGQDAASNGSK